MKESIDISKEEKNSMIGVKMNDTNYFNPVLDINDIYQISKESVNMITNKDFLYLKDRELHEYIPKPIIDPLEELENNEL
tara:strand:- start:394 stop:633 length:240 start_codon:yes stop_codon:yes gene_type:complete